MKMGRIKVFFCSFCLNRSPDQAANEQTYSQGIDVSHLATPHIASNAPFAVRSSDNSSPICDFTNKSDEDYHNQKQPSVTVDGASQNANVQENGREISGSQEAALLAFQLDDNRPQLSPTHSRLNLNNESQPPQGSPSQEQSHQPPLLQPQQNQPAYSDQDGQVMVYHPQQDAPTAPDGPDAKLSYDIISVREPLAKILAERQQLQQAQQQQRQVLGDHEYIEVYGERGSSCFYEEIAGSTTSSATYDQIGTASNHNYQALINAYAVTSRPSGAQQQQIEENNNMILSRTRSDSLTGCPDGGQGTDENVYNVTRSSSDQIDGNSSNMNNPKPSTSSANQTEPSTSQRSTSNMKDDIISPPVPVYSVINKKPRRGNAIIRATIENCRPPQPPPKNIMMTHQQSATSAIQTYQEPSTSMKNLNSPKPRTSPQLPSTSSYSTINDKSSDSINHHPRLPQPPPRFCKHPMLNSTNRPLPLPDNFNNSIGNNNNNCRTEKNHLQEYDDDTESINNGYELLTTNLDDDQIDVGYEKIREPNRYSGGSLSSQFCPLQALDNGGYESVQPIYSSPSNALAEPNYEAIGPPTASELAAAATARLTAAVAVMELQKQTSISIQELSNVQ